MMDGRRNVFFKNMGYIGRGRTKIGPGLTKKDFS